MNAITQKVTQRLLNSEAGFTLIEMLITVGIIVTLAVVVTPQLVNYIGYGKDSQMAREKISVSKGVRLMMVDKAVGYVNAEELTARNDWTAYPTGPGNTTPISPYLTFEVSTYFYCWDSKGNVTAQYESPVSCS
jgi:prepilin-type N-terminal cleavage/methylation domain-containing protein